MIAKIAKIKQKYIYAQILFLFVLILCSCGRRQDENFVMPPVTSPLSRNYIGYGVVNTSFTHVLAEPMEGSELLGNLRRGTSVRIIERRVIVNAGRAQTWLRLDTEQHGWVREEVMYIFDNENRARTAAQSMST